MRRFALLIFFVAILSDLSAQDWAPIGSKWHYRENFFEAFLIIEDYIKFESVVDTVYQGQDCQKISVRHQIVCSDRPETEYMFSRNDTVFFYDPNFNEWQILYDFTAEKGESWSFKIQDLIEDNTDTIRIVVDSTSSTKINQTQLKVQHVTYEYVDDSHSFIHNKSTIIENIGDTYFMFNYSPKQAWACDANVPTGLRCYEDNSLGLYETGIAPSCENIVYWTSIEDEAVNSRDDINMFLDQTHDIIFIHSKTLEEMDFRIFDLRGNQVNQGLIFNEKINISQLVQGIYIMEVYTNDKTLHRKLKFIKY